ncbi:NADase-type glycan-binding domain-containing protein, partial [Nocardioides sp.]|uniref:NADase-type glycan-binding domain-containing protein n=1 Tax=Nocardioides sp. TaxID=35761 RepID=UPI0037833FF6
RPAHPGQVPGPPRYPLFADEVGQPAGAADVPPGQPPPYPPPSYPPAPAPRGRRPWWPWLVLAAVLVLVVGVVAGVATLTGDDETGARARPGGHGSGSSGSAPASGGLSGRSTAQVPATAPPNQDTAGNRTTYDAANLLDGVPETCWRMPGDGTGGEVTVTLPGRTHLRSVGIVNGYAKTARDAQGRELDWYHGNRRVLAVEWVFDDGTTVAQDLDDTTAVQSVDVDVTTATVVLRLVEVSPPGTGPASRDYTAVSEISLVAG